MMLATDLLMWVADPPDDVALNVAATDLVMTRRTFPTGPSTGPWSAPVVPSTALTSRPSPPGGRGTSPATRPSSRSMLRSHPIRAPDLPGRPVRGLPFRPLIGWRVAGTGRAPGCAP